MDQSNTQVAQGRQDVWSIASAQAGAILSKADIAHRVEAIFTTPLASHQLQQAPRSGFGGRQSGDERDDLGGGLVGFGDGTGELGHLCDKGPGRGEIGIHLVTSLAGAHLAASPPAVGGLGLQRACQWIGEIGRQVVVEGRLIAFDSQDGLGHEAHA